MVDTRFAVACAVAVLMAHDIRAAKNMMVCLQSSTFDGEECTVIENRGGGNDIDTIPAKILGPSPHKSAGGTSRSSSNRAYASEPRAPANPCNACTRKRSRALKISQHVHDLCVKTEVAKAMHACSKAGAYPVLGNLDGRNRSVRPMRDGMLCCDKSKDTEAALQGADQINPSVEGCGLVPVGYTGRVCLVGTFEKWWADKTGHDACPYTRILKCEPGYLIDPDNCFQSHTEGSPGTTNTTGSAAGVELDGGPAKFTGGSTQSSSTTWGQTGGALGTCRGRARKRNDVAEEAYTQCMRTHNCGSERNNSDHPSM